MLAETCLKCTILVKICQTLEAFLPWRRLNFNIDDLKFRNLAKEWFMKLIMTKSNFKNTVMTSFK